MTAKFDMPKIGFGTWNRAPDIAYQGVKDALDIGYRHIDTAPSYNNEEAVGKAIIDSGIPRDEIFITAKVDPYKFGPGQVKPSVEDSYEKLGIEKADLLLLHFPSLYDKYPIEDYMAQFAEVYDLGMAQHIGVSNFTIRHLEETYPILGERPIYTNQVEIHPYMQNRPIVNYCASKNISTTAYSPLARGAILKDPILTQIAKTHACEASQIALAFLLHLGHTVIPSSSKRHFIQQNFDAANIELSDKDMDDIRNLERGMRLVNDDYTPDWDE